METQSIFKTSLSCAAKVVPAASGVGGLIFVFGWLVEHKDAVKEAVSRAWAAVLYAASFGNQFWAAVSIGILMMAVLAWSICMENKLPPELVQRYGVRLWLIGMVAIVVWIIELIAVSTTFDKLSDLTPYHGFALFTLWLPLLSLPFVFIFVMCAESEPTKQGTK